eukprot:TRINITY_DN25550_c0_g1_i1.p1 TRINITY_DN25550_c0_g1~~TRINITY_DN25550_c0_g1_i1.p1  ORF type:complete len:290 (+),score=45.42 TRINITY_DN25550_c0_g1_i1:126-995(+)
MRVDAYDVLGLATECKEGDVKKAYHKMSLQYHPDKVASSEKETAERKFNEIKQARDILQDNERRKIYDTFGVDLGEESPEMVMWTIGSGALMSPTAAIVLKTVVARSIFWLLNFSWFSWILLSLAIAAATAYYLNLSVAGMLARSDEGVAILINLAVLSLIVILNWILPSVADGISVFYLLSEVLGLEFFVNRWEIGAGGAVVSLVLAWLIRGWWSWIIGLQVLALVVLLLALTIASAIMRLWLDAVQVQHGDKLKQRRADLRALRQSMEDEISDLKKKIEQKSQKSSR